MSLQRKGRGFGIDIMGVDDVAATLDEIVRNTPDELDRAIYHEAGVEATESRRKTPWLTGALRGSTQTQRPVWRGRDVSCAINVGGPAAPYAVPVHENLEADHPRGGEAKFLEKTIRESASSMGRRIAARVNLNRLVR